MYYNSRPPFKHKTLVVDTQLASESPICISLEFLIKTLTSYNQAFENGDTQIKSQHFSTALVARYTFSLAGDTNALVRLSVFGSESSCSIDDIKPCSTNVTPDTPCYIPSAQGIGYVTRSCAVLSLESPKALQKLPPACLPSRQAWLCLKIGVRDMISIHRNVSTFRIAI
jgi:hypothetical protein